MRDTSHVHATSQKPSLETLFLVNEVLCAIFVPICLNAEMFWSVLHFLELKVFLGAYKSYKFYP